MSTTDTPEPFVRQQRRIQKLVYDIALDHTQSPQSRFFELDRLMAWMQTLKGTLRDEWEHEAEDAHLTRMKDEIVADIAAGRIPDVPEILEEHDNYA